MAPSYDEQVFREELRTLVTQDPGLPRRNPTLPFWQQPAHPDVGTIQSETLSSTTDIVVIGSGVTGCSVTRSLLEETNLGNPTVTVLEARNLTSGATGRNGGHLVSPVGHEFAGLAAMYGVEGAKEIARFSMRTIERVHEVVAGMGDVIKERSEIRATQKIVIIPDQALWEEAKASLAMFEKELPEFRDRHRIVDKEECEKEWGIYDVCGGIAQTAGALWPYRLCTEIFNSLLKAHPDRLSIETNTPVLRVSSNSSKSHPYLVETPRGNITAQKVIYCSNAYTSHLLPRLRGKIYPFRGHVSTQTPGPKFPDDKIHRSWSRMATSRMDPLAGTLNWGLYYMAQNAKTKDIFIGTENEPIVDAFSTDDTFVSEMAKRDLPTILPRTFSSLRSDLGPGEAPKLKAIWSGIMAMTADQVPLVGRLPTSATGRTSGEEWIAAGYNGFGMDKCWLAGESLVAMIAGKESSMILPKAYKVTEERLQKGMDLERIFDFYTSWEMPESYHAEHSGPERTPFAAKL